MDVQLNAHEARVLGVLIEKSFTTPDQYPLTPNSIQNGCNQKSCRDPQTNFVSAEITVALTGLRAKHLAGASHPVGSRVEKWKHSAAERLSVGERELAVLAELLLRGPQPPGSLRSNANRMRSVSNQEELMQLLAKLTEKGLARRLPPATGSRAERYGQTIAATFDGEEPAPSPSAPAAPAESAAAEPAPPRVPPPAPTPAGGSREQELEARVARLERQLAQLAETLGAELGE